MLHHLLARVRSLDSRKIQAPQAASILNSLCGVECDQSIQKEKLIMKMISVLLDSDLKKQRCFLVCGGALKNLLNRFKNGQHHDNTLNLVRHLNMNARSNASKLSISEVSCLAHIEKPATRELDKVEKEKIEESFEQTYQSLWTEFPDIINRSQLFEPKFSEVDPSKLQSHASYLKSTNTYSLCEFLYASEAILRCRNLDISSEKQKLGQIFTLSASAFHKVSSALKVARGLKGNALLLQHSTASFVQITSICQRNDAVSHENSLYSLKLVNRVLVQHKRVAKMMQRRLITLKTLCNTWRVLYLIPKNHDPIHESFVKELLEITLQDISSLGSVEISGILRTITDHNTHIDNSITSQLLQRYTSTVKDQLKEHHVPLAHLKSRLKRMSYALKAGLHYGVTDPELLSSLISVMATSITTLMQANATRKEKIVDIDFFEISLTALSKLQPTAESKGLFRALCTTADSAFQDARASRVFRCIKLLTYIAQHTHNPEMFTSVCAVVPIIVDKANHSQLISLALYIMRAAPRGSASALSSVIYERLAKVLIKMRTHENAPDGDEVLISIHDLSAWLRFFCTQEQDAPEKLSCEILRRIFSGVDAFKDPFLSSALVYYVTRYHGQIIHDALCDDTTWLTVNPTFPTEGEKSLKKYLLSAFASAMMHFDGYKSSLTAKQAIFLLKALTPLPSAFQPQMQALVEHIMHLPASDIDWNTMAILVSVLAHKQLATRTAVVAFLDAQCAVGFRGITLQNVVHIYTSMALMRIHPSRLHREIWLQFIEKIAGASPKQLAVMLEARVLYKAQSLVGSVIVENSSTVMAEAEQNALVVAACRDKLQQMRTSEGVACGACLFILGVAPTNTIFSDIIAKVSESLQKDEMDQASLRPANIANFIRMLFAVNAAHWELLTESEYAQQVTLNTTKVLKAFENFREALWGNFLCASAMLTGIREIGERLAKESLQKRCTACLLAFKPFLAGIQPFIRALIGMHNQFGTNSDALKDCLIQKDVKKKIAEDPALAMLAAVVDPEHVLTLIKAITWLYGSLQNADFEDIGEGSALDASFLWKQLVPAVSAKDLVHCCAFLLHCLHALCHRIPVKHLEAVFYFVDGIGVPGVQRSKMLVIETVQAVMIGKGAGQG